MFWIVISQLLSIPIFAIFAYIILNEPLVVFGSTIYCMTWVFISAYMSKPCDSKLQGEKMKKAEILEILNRELIDDLEYDILFDYNKPEFNIWRG